MFNRLPNAFESWMRTAAGASPRTADAPSSPRIAAAALLVEAARADGAYLDEEKDVIDVALGNLFAIGSDDARALRVEGETAQDSASDMQGFTRALVDGLSMDERIALLEGLWGVVLADDEREAHEITLMRRLAALLYVSDHDSAGARRRAQAALGG